MAKEKHTAEEKTRMVERIDALRASGKTLPEACILVGKELGKSGSSVNSLYNWWKSKSKEKTAKVQQQQRSTKKKSNNIADLNDIIGPLTVALNGKDLNPDERNDRSIAARDNVRNFQERMLTLVERIMDIGEKS